ncbi:hypothetical protein ACQKWADRAFT_297612 [Trichoderma austrokoningii]
MVPRASNCSGDSSARCTWNSYCWYRTKAAITHGQFTNRILPPSKRSHITCQSPQGRRYNRHKSPLALMKSRHPDLEPGMYLLAVEPASDAVPGLARRQVSSTRRRGMALRFAVRAGQGDRGSHSGRLAAQGGRQAARFVVVDLLLLAVGCCWLLLFVCCPAVAPNQCRGCWSQTRAGSSHKGRLHARLCWSSTAARRGWFCRCLGSPEAIAYHLELLERGMG